MWGKLQTHGDKKNDAEVLAIAAAGAPLDVMAIVKVTIDGKTYETSWANVVLVEE